MKAIKKMWQLATKTQPGRFLISGQVVMLADLAPYYLLLVVLGDSNYILAHNATSVFSSLINFVIQKYWVFNDTRPGTLWKQVFSFTISTIGFIFVSNIVLWALVSGLHLSPMVAKLIKIGIMGIVSWFVSSKAIFQGQKP